MFKLIALVLLAMGSVSCVTGVLCPERLDFPKGARCDVLIIPTPWDPICDIPAAVGTIREVARSSRKGG